LNGSHRVRYLVENEFGVENVGIAGKLNGKYDHRKGKMRRNKDLSHVNPTGYQCGCNLLSF
jgi:hypothetical protein